MEENEKYNEKGHFRDEEEVSRIEMQKNIQAIHKRSEEFIRLCEDWLARTDCGFSVNYNKKHIENKGVKDEMGEKQCTRCANQCKANGEMDYCDKFIDEEEAERTANAERIEELRKRCEEFMQGLVYDFGDIIVADTADISETERNEVKWNINKKTTYVDKQPFIDFRLCFTAYKKD